MMYELVVQRKDGHIFAYHVPKRPTTSRKLTFDIPKFKFQSGLVHTTSNLWAFLRQTGLWEPNPQNNVQESFADYESCEQCRDFGT